jgi:hypothetical protein
MPLDHWVVIPDDDLALIQDGPDTWTHAAMEAWIRDVMDIIEDGLETA